MMIYLKILSIAIVASLVGSSNFRIVSSLQHEIARHQQRRQDGGHEEASYGQSADNKLFPSQNNHVILNNANNFYEQRRSLIENLLNLQSTKSNEG